MNRGVSIIAAAGFTSVFRSNLSESCDFVDTFPAICPYVTAVGSVNGLFASPSTSGGFSRYFERPSYQDDAVKEYLEKLGDKNEGKFEPTRRYPDIAVQGERALVVKVQ